MKPNKIKKFIQKIPHGIDEICILAGDIGNPYKHNYNVFMQFINENFKKSFVIAGNHEYYNKSKTLEETRTYLKEYFTKYDNICFLDNEYVYYENTCFIGTTLWSNITNPVYEINDTRAIPTFDYIQYNQLHAKSVEFLTNTLNDNDKDNCVVITHHVPSYSLIDDKYKTPEMIENNQWFYCDMLKLIETYQNKIQCWIYGHTHTPSKNVIYKIPFLCNPIGYPNENYNLYFQLPNIVHDLRLRYQFGT
jgi:predicted phosphohydrolase